MKNFLFLTFITFTVFVTTANACRFWVAVGDPVKTETVVKQLLKDPFSLKSLGKEYKDGWSVGYFDGPQEIIYRSAMASDTDLAFVQMVQKAASEGSNIVYSHLRRASSGCVEGVPNPHPFIFEGNDQTWVFGHNGGIKKDILIQLIGDDYLNEHQPKVCNYNPPDSWIDSELYFIYLMKNIEEANWNVEAGLINGLHAIFEQVDDEDRYLNFFLSDSKTVWAFRKGNTLFYYDSEDISIVSSSVPTKDQLGWNKFPDYQIAVLEQGEAIHFFSVLY